MQSMAHGIHHSPFPPFPETSTSGSLSSSWLGGCKVILQKNARPGLRKVRNVVAGQADQGLFKQQSGDSSALPVPSSLLGFQLLQDPKQAWDDKVTIPPLAMEQNELLIVAEQDRRELTDLNAGILHLEPRLLRSADSFAAIADDCDEGAIKARQLSKGGEAEKPTRAAAVAEVKGNMVEIKHGAETMYILSTGAIELWRTKGNVRSLISSGQVQLPARRDCSAENCEMSILDGHNGAVSIRWSDHAVLRVMPAGGDLDIVSSGCSRRQNTECSWAKDLEEGFVCEFSVRECVGEVEMAEVTLDMQTAGHWFGGGHFMKQHWPLNRGAFEVGPFFPFDNGPNGLNTLLAPQWMTSRGLMVLADPDTPFFHVGFNAPVEGPHDGWIQRTWGTGVQNLTKEFLPSSCHGQGDGKLRLQARSSFVSHEMLHPLRDWMPPPLLGDNNRSERRLALRFALCAHKNVKEAALAALRTLNRPSKPPPREMVDAPIWTTWARYHAKVSQAKVERFANEIVARGLGRSVMEIDDKWQSKYGDFDFDPIKFPDPKAMVELLHVLGFKVTLWIMPFVEEASKAYQEGAPKGYFITSDAPATPGLKAGFFKWWQPVPAAALDVTNPEAVQWFVQRLKQLQADFDIDGFKFDAGEPCFLPRKFRTYRPITSPTEYTRLYVQEVASNFDFAEVRTGHRTNSAPLLTRMGDRFSTWSSGNGLRSVIPTLLTSGLLGYPFCLPDMIGGNGYFGMKPDVELLVRWAQANALMPAMQFSIAPWDLSTEAEKLCNSVLELRHTLTNHIFGLMEEACKALAPVCRPMWWLDPEDSETFQINDQFAIGDDLIVAPVVVKGQKCRDVYLPRGRWAELLAPGTFYDGPCWLHSHEAPLHKIPIFRRVLPPTEPSTSPASIPVMASLSDMPFVSSLAQGLDVKPSVNC